MLIRHFSVKISTVAKNGEKSMSIKKILAAVLAVTLVSQTFLTAFSLAEFDRTPDYTGRVLAAINTDYDNSESSFSAVCPEATGSESDGKEAAGNADGDKLLDAVIDDVEPLSPAAAALRQSSMASAPSPDRIAADYKVGDKKVIKSSYSPEGSASLVCVYTSDNCTVWGELPDDNSEIDEGVKNDCIGLGEFFDNNYSKALSLYGDKRIDTDGDGKIAIFVYAMEDVGGYFSYRDLVDGVGRIGNVWMTTRGSGNACDCVHILQYSLEFMCSTVLHEYEHYLNASYCFAGKNNINYLNYSETYINEAFSTAAEFVINDYDRYTYGFSYAIQSPAESSLVNWTQDYDAYRRSFVFGQYIRIRYAQLINDTASEYPGKGIYKKVLESRTRDNDNNTLGIIADILYPNDKYPNLKDNDARCRQLLTDFWLAVYCNDAEGIHGFGGEEWADDLDVDRAVADSLPSEESAVINSSMAAFYYINSYNIGTAKVIESEEGMVYVAIDGAFNTLTYNANGGECVYYPEIELIRGGIAHLHNKCNRYGYNFCGWALTPDAKVADYYWGDEIAVTKDTVIYAVWERAQAIISETAYQMNIPDKGYDRCYCFTPEESGYYTIDGDGYSSQKILTPDNWLEPIYAVLGDDNDHPITSKTYMLDAGKEYSICFEVYHNDCDYFTFSIKREPVSYTLTYDMNSPYLDNYSVCGRAAYPTDFSGGNNVGFSFLGWSTEPDATVAEYLPGDIITLTCDTVIYAVWKSAQVLEEGAQVPLAGLSNGRYPYFAFTPQTTGQYQFKLSNSENSIKYDFEADVYDDSRNIVKWFNFEDETNGVCSLIGGVTYYIMPFSDYDEQSDTHANMLSVTKVSDEVSLTLKYDCGEGVATFEESGGMTYTVIDYVPVSLYGNEFLGWRSSSSGEIYHAGDEIIIYEDTTLNAVWDGDENTDISLGEFLTNAFRAFVKLCIYAFRTDLLEFLGIKSFFGISS